MKIRFLKDWGDHKAGDILDDFSNRGPVLNVVMSSLIQGGYVEKIEEPAFASRIEAMEAKIDRILKILKRSEE